MSAPLPPAPGAGPARDFDFDAAYRLLALAHRGLDADASAALNARLVLLLAAECADLDALRRLVGLARDVERPPASG